MVWQLIEEFLPTRRRLQHIDISDNRLRSITLPSHAVSHEAISSEKSDNLRNDETEGTRPQSPQLSVSFDDVTFLLSKITTLEKVELSYNDLTAVHDALLELPKLALCDLRYNKLPGEVIADASSKWVDASSSADRSK